MESKETLKKTTLERVPRCRVESTLTVFRHCVLCPRLRILREKERVSEKTGHLDLQSTNIVFHRPKGLPRHNL